MIRAACGVRRTAPPETTPTPGPVNPPKPDTPPWVVAVEVVVVRGGLFSASP